MGSEAGAITSVLDKVGISLPAASVPGGMVLLPLIYGVGTALPVIVVARRFWWVATLMAAFGRRVWFLA